ncbi:hypothetical protein Q3C01_24000 [Bradyrhizobium sp. UFLA05-109]
MKATYRRNCSRRRARRYLIFDKLVLCGPRTGIAEATVARELNNIKVALLERRDRVLDDFVHGMTGDERMKKDAVVSIVNTQSNSQGAVQQVGVGEFSQSAIINRHQQLVAAIDAERFPNWSRTPY